MIQNFKVDQAGTFGATVFLSCEPKYKFGTTDQECTKDGTPKWECQILGAFRDGFGRMNNEVMKVGVASTSDPGAGLTPYTQVELVDFEVGVMEKTKKDQNGQEKVIGVQVWYRAQGIQPAGAASSPSSGGATPSKSSKASAASDAA